MPTSMITEYKSSVLEKAVEAKIEKIDCFVENGIFSVSDRTEHALSPFIYRTVKDCSIAVL